MRRTPTHFKKFSGSPRNRGFNLVQILVVIAIALLLGTIGIATFYSARKTKELGPTADGIVEVLERAKGDAIAGKNGQSFGVYFASSTYTYFQGTAYSAGNSNNRVTNVFGDLYLSTTFSGNALYFSHLTGLSSASGTVTVTAKSGSTGAKIVGVGFGGDISVIQ
jgi:Tfp pilus assembly protein FimT